MKILPLLNDYKEWVKANKLRHEHPSDSDALQTIHEDTRLIAPDGSAIAVLLAQRLEAGLLEPAYKSWWRVNDRLSNRASAVATPSLHRYTQKTGAPSPRSGVHEGVLKVDEMRQGIFGKKQHFEILEKHKRLIKRVNSLYKQYAPDEYAIQRLAVKKAPDLRLWHTAFSNVYVLKQGRTGYHEDGNLSGVMTCIMPLGCFKGGALVLARWRIAIAYKPGDLLLFDAEQLHGNLAFEGERLSAAFYCARQLATTNSKTGTCISREMK